jgi:septal ring-binding cell division protein DamX
MRIIRYVSFFIILAVLVSACKTQQATTTTAPQSNRYSEDLAVHRPKVESTAVIDEEKTDDKKPTTYVEPKIAVNKKLDGVLDSISRINLSKNSIDGFTIQVYSGKREEALSAKKTLSNAFPDIESEVHFTEPIFRVKIGKYYTRLDAQQDYSEVKRFFPAAIIIPEKISIK